MFHSISSYLGYFSFLIPTSTSLFRYKHNLIEKKFSFLPFSIFFFSLSYSCKCSLILVCSSIRHHQTNFLHQIRMYFVDWNVLSGWSLLIVLKIIYLWVLKVRLFIFTIVLIAQISRNYFENNMVKLRCSSQQWPNAATFPHNSSKFIASYPFSFLYYLKVSAVCITVKKKSKKSEKKNEMKVNFIKQKKHINWKFETKKKKRKRGEREKKCNEMKIEFSTSMDLFSAL